MAFSLLILVLRIVAIVLLYLFFLVVIVVMWRDWRAAVAQVGQRREQAIRPLGYLAVVQAGQSGLVLGERIPLQVVTQLGRAPTNIVVIEDAFASSEHARLSFRSSRWWLEDLGSRNGTLLNEERLTAPAIVTTGDVIGIGGVRLRIELEEA